MPTSASNTSYTTVAGTSFAAGVVTGAAGALTQLTRNLTGNPDFTYQADQMKALFAHTANDAGTPGPDVLYGWGLIDAKSAAEVIINKNQNKAIFEQRTLISGTSQVIEVTAGSEPLKATISWVDPAAIPFTSSVDLQNNHTSRLVNDLDLRIEDTATGTVYYPWKLNIADPLAGAGKGDNVVDNIEQVIIDMPSPGRIYKITVSNKGNLVNDTGTSSPSKFAIVVTSSTNNSLSINEDTISDCSKLISIPTRIRENEHISLPSATNQVIVYDMSGKKIIDLNKTNLKNLNLPNLSKGVYFINIKTSNCNIVRKVIKE